MQESNKGCSLIRAAVQRNEGEYGRTLWCPIVWIFVPRRSDEVSLSIGQAVREYDVPSDRQISLAHNLRVFPYRHALAWNPGYVPRSNEAPRGVNIYNDIFPVETLNDMTSL